MGAYNLIIINDFAHINGGAGKVALLSALGLARRGHDVTLFSAVAPVMAELSGMKIKLICTDQQEIRADPNRFRAARQGLWNATAGRRIAQLLDSCDPSCTIIHVHAWTKSLSTSVIYEAVKRRFPIVCTLHDYFIACPNGGFFNYRTNNICALRAMSSACLATNCDKNGYLHKVWRVGRQGIQRTWGRVPSGISHFITISRFSRNILGPYLPYGAATYDIPNPVPGLQESPASCGENHRFVAVGRVSPEKGLDLFAQAGRKNGTAPVVVGDGEGRRSLESRFPEIVVTGWLSDDDVRAQMKQARALVLPSLWYETQGMVVLEAAALGIPAIVPDNCAARDSVIDGLTGLWFETGNSDDLADKMRKLKDKETATHMGQAAYDKFWADPPTMDKHLQLLEEVYSSVMGNASHTPSNAVKSQPARESLVRR